MKKITFLLFFGAVGNVFSQISTNSVPQDTSTDQNVFMDAASNFNYSANSSHSVGKGLGFPQTDLTKFKFITTNLDGINYPTYFDGMIVYNIATGKTNDPSLTTQTEGLTPGFYYFYNPNGETNQSLSSGKWVRIGDGSANRVLEIATNEVATNVKVENKQVYTIKGQFTSDGSTQARINFPAGMTSLYNIKIYKKTTSGSSQLVHAQLYDYNLTASSGNNVTFGSGVMSTSIPAGTYDYVLEYFK